jgi:WS/DGAT/MGAT family acyltransferase
MGEGHNATGRALDQAVRARWPGVDVRWLDTLDVMGRGVGPLFRSIYVANVQQLPWLYEFFYGAVRRYRWLARSSKRFVGAWCGRKLTTHVVGYRPDVILSTYPLGTAGLEWLRRFKGLDAPIGAWVSDFAPHPFWIYQDIDLNLVMHPVALPPAVACEPDAAVTVSAPPVTGNFTPGDRAAARIAVDLPPDAFVALVSCGSLGFGSVESAARTLLDADPNVVVVVACGRNDALREKVAAAGPAEVASGRLRPLGWTDDMVPLTVASDVMVTNAGGATCLEALACGRAVLMYQPIAAHGRANAELMAKAGLAEVCEGDRELTAAVRGLLAEPERLTAMEKAAIEHAESRTVSDGLDDLLAAALARQRRGRARSEATIPRPSHPTNLRKLRNAWTALARQRRGTTVPTPDHPATERRLRAEDALFVHVQTPEVPQQVGAVLVLDAKADGSATTLADAADLLDAAPGLFGRIEPGSAWRHPRWHAVPGSAIDLVELVEVGTPDGPSDLNDAMDAFFSVPLDGTEGTGRAQLVHGVEEGRSAILLKLHHATADGIAVIGALVGRTRGRDVITEQPTGQRPRLGARQQLAAVRELAVGVWALARSGRAADSDLNGPVLGPQRHHALVDLPVAEVRQVAKTLHIRTTDLATTLVGEALHRVLHADVGHRGPDRLRVMMPRSTRTTATLRTSGNHTGAASVDLPVGPMSLAERATRTRAATEAQVVSSAPHAAHAVVQVLGVLPPWLHGVAARLVYRSTWFNAIASVLPGARSPVVLHGARMSAVYPVLSLAPGVKLSVGIMTWADLVTVCFAGDGDVAHTIDQLADAVRAAFKEAAK